MTFFIYIIYPGMFYIVDEFILKKKKNGFSNYYEKYDKNYENHINDHPSAHTSE